MEEQRVEKAAVIHRLTHRDTAIEVRADGWFYATPAGARKERQCSTLSGLKRLIDECLQHQETLRRPACSQEFKGYCKESGRVKVVRYLGTRGRNSARHGIGHAFEVVEGKEAFTHSPYGAIRAVPASVTAENITLIEDAHRAIVEAQEALQDAVELHTVSLDMTRFSTYHPTLGDLTEAQEKMLTRLRSLGDL